MENYVVTASFSWEILIAIIGALAWIPWIFDQCKHSKLYGSIISNFMNQGKFNDKNGTMHFLKLSITCMNKCFNVKEISIKVKYVDDNTWYNGTIFWARTSKWLMPDNKTTKNLIIPNNEFLGFINMFDKDKSGFYYLTFLVEKDTFKEFETVKIDFNNFKKTKNVETIELKISELNPDKILFDDSIWKD